MEARTQTDGAGQTWAFAPGLVAAFGFDERSGQVAADTSGKGNDATLSGAGWSDAGRYGSALTLDGVDDWATVADSATLDLSRTMTLEAWVKPTTLSSWRTVVMKETASGYSYALYANTSGNRPRGYAGSGYTDGPSQLPSGAWTTSRSPTTAPRSASTSTAPSPPPNRAP